MDIDSFLGMSVTIDQRTCAHTAILCFAAILVVGIRSQSDLNLVLTMGIRDCPDSGNWQSQEQSCAGRNVPDNAFTKGPFLRGFG